MDLCLPVDNKLALIKMGFRDRLSFDIDQLLSLCVLYVSCFKFYGRSNPSQFENRNHG